MQWQTILQDQIPLFLFLFIYHVLRREKYLAIIISRLVTYTIIKKRILKNGKFLSSLNILLISIIALNTIIDEYLFTDFKNNFPFRFAIINFSFNFIIIQKIMKFIESSMDT